MTEPVLGGETRDRLEAIRKRAEEATPGPWQCWNAFGPVDKSGLHGIARIGPSGSLRGIIGDLAVGRTDLYATEADAQFVANAREDVPWLLGEVSRLRERVKELEGVVETIMGQRGFEPEPPSVEGSPDP